MPLATLARTVAAAVLAALLLAAPAHAVRAKVAAAECPGAKAVPTAAGLADAERTTLCLLNLERERRDLGALRLNDKLTRASAGHSRDMVERDFFSHESPGGGTVSRRIKASGYLAGARSYAFGENIAWGTGSLSSPLRIVRSWMRSPGHKANILRRSFDEIGVGIAAGAPGQGDAGATYTTAFGARS